MKPGINEPLRYSSQNVNDTINYRQPVQIGFCLNPYPNHQTNSYVAPQISNLNSDHSNISCMGNQKSIRSYDPFCAKDQFINPYYPTPYNTVPQMQQQQQQQPFPVQCITNDRSPMSYSSYPGMIQCETNNIDQKRMNYESYLEEIASLMIDVELTDEVLDQIRNRFSLGS